MENGILMKLEVCLFICPDLETKTCRCSALPSGQTLTIAPPASTLHCYNIKKVLPEILSVGKAFFGNILPGTDFVTPPQELMSSGIPSGKPA
jgi:hypothetical protein